MSLSVDVVNTQGKKVDQVDLAEGVFQTKGSMALVHEVVNAYLANQRRGTHSTKTRGEVRGGGHKPWRQKGTGRARVGSIRSGLWRGGGVIFGPKPRSYYQAVSQAKRHSALRIVLSNYLKEDRIQVIDEFSVKEAKTKKVADVVKKMGWPKKTLLIVDQVDEVFQQAAQNLAGFDFVLAKNLNSYDVLLSEKLIVTKSALDALQSRLDKKGSAE